MNDGIGDVKALRDYLLGTLKDDITFERIELQSMTDDKYTAEINMAENELIEQYLDGELSSEDSAHFVNHFLASPERRQEVRLTENLRRISAETRASVPQAKRGWFDRTSYFSIGRLRFAAFALVVIVAGLGIWRFAIYQSDVDKGLAHLRTAYRGQRVMEPRITALPDHRPFEETRGAAPTVVDPRSHDLAERYILDAAQGSPDGQSLHALGLLYLTDKKYDRALQEFNAALALTPNDASLQGDAGAAYLEIARVESSKSVDGGRDGARVLEHLNASLKHLDTAILLAPKMAEARFNRAICLTLLGVAEQAKQAWREYLQLDSTSEWADEARTRLAALEGKSMKERSAAELEVEFLAASAEQDHERAWQLLSQNREMIREKYLPQRLAMSSLTASGDTRKTFQRALALTGDLELKRIGDPFASEIAVYYSTLPEKRTEELRQAQEAVRSGYGLCLTLKYEEARIQFTMARDLFLRAGNKWESKLSDYYIAYCLINEDRTSEGTERLQHVTSFAKASGYKWLEATALYWLASGYRSTKQATLAKTTHERALAIADEISDSYATQRNLSALANYSSLVGQRNAALKYLDRNITLSSTSGTSLRQKYRNQSDASEILFGAGLANASTALAVESVAIADQLGDSMFQALSRSNAGLANSQLGNLDEARSWINAGKERAATIADETSRNKMVAYALLTAGYAENKAGNFEAAERSYVGAATLFEAMQMPAEMYFAQRGKLLSYKAMGKSEDLERQIPITVKLNEDFRDKIYDERERTSYFDSQESVYDIAIDYELARGQYEKAYDHAEISSARSLLDWLGKGADISGDDKNIEVLLKETAEPLGLSAIREKMPENVQIVQYSILDDKVVIWLVSREKFFVAQTNITSPALREKVETYTRLLRQHDGAERKTGTELFDLLVAPVREQLNPLQEICIVPNKFLFELPFAALAPADGGPLLGDFSISYAPSANIFLICTENATTRVLSSQENLLSIGNPAFDLGAGLPDLPAAQTEAREIGAFYPQSKILIGREATKNAVLRSMKDAEIVHVAGHYVVNQDEPLSSYLLVAAGDGTIDGILTNRELIAEKLPKAKLIVLSACRSGVESYYDGEGLIGLSRTFVAAGAPLVVGSQWSVETEATGNLMKRFHYYRRQQNMNTAGALRAAQLEMANDPNGRFRNPYYWAGFAVFGGYAAY